MKQKKTKPKTRKTKSYSAPIPPPTTKAGGKDDMGGEDDLELCEDN